MRHAMTALARLIAGLAFVLGLALPAAAAEGARAAAGRKLEDQELRPPAGQFADRLTSDGTVDSGWL